jgi:hypothetical protein
MRFSRYSKQDEYYTPAYAITPILDYIPSKATVWCPFDTEQSLYVQVLRNHGCKVLPSHIRTGQDFFTYEPPEEYDYIISNPPFSLKTEVLSRLIQLNKPFAMLISIPGLFESKRFHLLKNTQFELMLFDKRVSFFTSYATQAPTPNPPFSTVYLTKGVLPQKIMFCALDKHANDAVPAMAA